MIPTPHNKKLLDGLIVTKYLYNEMVFYFLHINVNCRPAKGRKEERNWNWFANDISKAGAKYIQKSTGYNHSIKLYLPETIITYTEEFRYHTKLIILCLLILLSSKTSSMLQCFQFWPFKVLQRKLMSVLCRKMHFSGKKEKGVCIQE